MNSSYDDWNSSSVVASKVSVVHFKEPVLGKEFEELVSKAYAKMCDSVASNFDRKGFHPATLIGYGNRASFQLDATGLAEVPNPKACTYAVMQHMADDAKLKPKAFIFIVESDKLDANGYGKPIKHVLSVTLTTEYGDHRVCMFDIGRNNSQDNWHIISRNGTKFIYEVDSPMSDIWKIWNKKEDFGAVVKLQQDIPSGTDLGDLLRGFNRGLNN